MDRAGVRGQQDAVFGKARLAVAPRMIDAVTGERRADGPEPAKAAITRIKSRQRQVGLRGVATRDDKTEFVVCRRLAVEDKRRCGGRTARGGLATCGLGQPRGLGHPCEPTFGSCGEIEAG